MPLPCHHHQLCLHQSACSSDLDLSHSREIRARVHAQFCVSTLQGSLSVSGPRKTRFSLDSGAAFSCIPQTAFQHDRRDLLRHGKLLMLVKAIRVSMYDSIIADCDEYVMGARIYIGSCSYTIDFAVVPGGSRDYLLGTIFGKMYDVMPEYGSYQCRLGCPRDAWLGHLHSKCNHKPPLTRHWCWPNKA